MLDFSLDMRPKEHCSELVQLRTHVRIGQPAWPGSVKGLRSETSCRKAFEHSKIEPVGRFQALNML